MVEEQNPCKYTYRRRLVKFLPKAMFLCGGMAFLMACKPVPDTPELRLKLYGFPEGKNLEEKHVFAVGLDSLLFANGQKLWKRELFFAESEKMLVRLQWNQPVPEHSAYLRLVRWYRHAPKGSSDEPASWKCTLHLESKVYEFTGSTATIKVSIPKKQSKAREELFIRSYGHNRIRISTLD